MRGDVLLKPAGKLDVFISGFGQQAVHGFSRRMGFVEEGGRHKAGADAVEFGLADGVWRAILREDALVLGFHLIHIGLTFGLHQNFDAGFV